MAERSPVPEVPRAFTGVVAGLALAGAMYVGATSLRGLPAIGPLLDPARGIWAVSRAAELPAVQVVALQGLGGTVEVRYDDRGVPHIFGASETDAYRALGWVHARDRLFQMELTQRAVAGTLTEFVGARALPLDREARRQGLAVAAEAKWAALDRDAPVRAFVAAYMDGVNAYVRAMRPNELPIEYRLLGRKPRTFQPQDTYYLLARMSLTLAWQDSELQRGAVESLVGAAATAALFPVNAPIQEPIEPVAGRQAPRYTHAEIPAPQRPDAKSLAEARRWMETRALFAAEPQLTRGEAVVGSNNWAVAPGRTTGGHALLSGDPHLQLTLPSIWYEAHMVVPGVLDVYGVTLPLAPLVPIGFNRDVAWTATNTGADVLDFYLETVDDTTAPARYRVDGAWRELESSVATYEDPTGAVLATDTLYRTHRGPMVRSPIGYVSMRWTALELSDEGTAFHDASLATSAAEWYEAMANYRAPAQNFLVADRGGHIGIRSTGRYPLRPGDGRGDKVFDGSLSASDWTGDWPLSQYPTSMDPAQGYLASANQQPVDPAVRPGYLGWDWPSPWRAIRINGILRADAAMTPEKMRLAHTDPRSALTDAILPPVRDAVAAARRRGVLQPSDSAAMAFLDRWDGRFDIESRGAVLFDQLNSALTRRTWDEFVIPGEDRRVATPGSSMLVRLLQDGSSPWWDDGSTADVRETRDDILLLALRDAWTTARTRFGNDPEAWRWGKARRMNIHHLLRLPGFGRESLSVQSGPGTLSPSESGGTHGASWRFVVELGEELTASGTYPGGQSGNPVSTRYADRVPEWQRGALSPLRTPRSAADLPDSATSSRLTLRPAP
ncbi:MAG TPA: penicillin acylase family protein [Gemmatimonadaceae bacterium]|nr:penicillin acylase family protein [Gemmatimonadaceae bacterium]